MAVFKCKMCGGDLEVVEGNTTCECEYCGTLQTLPSLDNEKKLNLFNRANRLRFNNEFDKAAAVYESIVAEFPEEAEAYWGLCLCKYGIEYVDDPTTAKKIPTCHRTSYDSIFNDSNFEMALEYADMVAQRVYREEAKEIDRLQQSILEIAKNEKPYDIFICYKETAEDGQRTKDSVLAQDMYDALTAKGYKVFFSRITLEDKLGQEYEPYIFSALNSAKIMLAVGTKYEYYNAVWVKNEWSRFLDMMNKDKSKVLIPCYADIDAYDMPQEFKNLQGQDMGKVGFMQDLVRGIEKIIPLGKTEQLQQPVIQQVIAGTTTNTENLLKRGNLALEDQKWEEADKFYDRVLDENAEEARAYLGKLMAELKVSSESALGDVCQSFDENPSYKKICRFANDDLKSRITNYCIQANYQYACKLLEKATTVEDYSKVIELFNKNPNYKDSVSKVTNCNNSIKEIEYEQIYKEATEYLKFNKIEQVKYALSKFESISNWKDSESKVDECKRKIKKITCESIYVQAVKLLNSQKYSNVKEAKEKFESIVEWENSKELIQQCTEIIERYEYRLKYAERDRLHSISAAANYSIGLKSDGTVVMSGNIEDPCTIYNQWTDIISISAGTGHFVGLKSDGSVVADGNNTHGQCKVNKWANIISISAGIQHTVGLLPDGRVLATGNNDYGQCNVWNWSDIIAIYAGGWHTVGLKSDGTVVAVGRNDHGQCNVSEWKDILSISAGETNTAGVKIDGTVVTTVDTQKYENDMYNQIYRNVIQEISKWKSISRIETIGGDFWGIESDGHLIAALLKSIDQVMDYNDLKNTIDVSIGRSHVICLKSTGDAIAFGKYNLPQCNMSNFHDLKINDISRDFYSNSVRTEKNEGIIYSGNSSSSSGGCYIATCVYGSYDCPQVWTLRRYRDYTLAQTWYGRAFVHLYYAISPTLVKWFGHTEWFRGFWKSKLDRMVSDLQKNGVENTAYQDRKW